MALLERDPGRARQMAREAMVRYLDNFPNYVNNLRRVGYGEDDFGDGGSDRLVDDLVVWGDPDDVIARVHEHLEAGADHVCVQPLGPDLDSAMAQMQALAPQLTAV
jgi:probable F420-dependent oxidoreductase